VCEVPFILAGNTFRRDYYSRLFISSLDTRFFNKSRVSRVRIPNERRVCFIL